MKFPLRLAIILKTETGMINFWDGEDDIAQWLPTMCPDWGAQGSISGINCLGGNFEVLQLYWLDESEQ